MRPEDTSTSDNPFERAAGGQDITDAFERNSKSWEGHTRQD